ncbi:MAG: lysyl oxidase family protein, partial [Flavobacteriales bacterium]
MKHTYSWLCLCLLMMMYTGINAQNALTLNLTTDCWAAETSWNVTDAGGTEVVSSTTWPLANDSLHTLDFDLPDGCYTLNILDSYGDGMYGSQYGSCEVNGNYELVDASANVLAVMTAVNADFGNAVAHDFSLPFGAGGPGCTDPNATNYESCAATDDGSCTYPAVVADFTITGGGCPGSSIQLTDASSALVTGWSWDIPGSDILTSTDQNPVISYASSGTYTVTLTATDDHGGQDITSQDIIVTDGMELVIDIVADNYPQETTWTLTDESGVEVANGDSNGATVCIQDNCHQFTIFDSYGDGICCQYGEGSFTLTLDGTEIGTGGEFGDFQTVNLNCAPGFDCNNPIDLDLGEHTTTMTDTWYTFTPPSNGQYRVTTCNRSTCDTRIYIYDYCNMDLFNNSEESFITYNDDFCGVQSEVTPLLAGGDTYYIRILDANDGCGGEGFGFALEYMGQISGCTDPLACNYLPIAEVPTTCYFPGDPECPNIGPDLEILGDVFYDSMYYTTLTNNDECYINEGCLAGFGERQIIRFTTHIKNIGTEDYFIGDPTDQPDQFEYDDCHNHWHYEGYAEYALFDDLGAPLPQVGFKNGFCVLDLECSDGGTAKYGCSNMGITAGCGDIYSSGLACQWVDVTDVDPGTYTLVMRTNWTESPDANGSYELSYDNNWAAVCFTFDRDVNGDVIDFVKSVDCPVSFDCSGSPFGNSQPDCEGNCNGIAVKGDVNGSGDLEAGDADTYIQDILGNDVVVSPCTDLNNDGDINITDAALATGCSFYGPDHVDEGGVHDHCIFDDEVINPNHTTTLSVGEINTDLGYIDVHVLNPDNEIVGYEFEVSGMTILSVENLADPLEYDVLPQASLGGVKVLAVSYDDQVFPKNLAPVPLVRLYYANTFGTDICIAGITDIVNEDFHNVLTVIGDCQSLVAADFADFAADAMTVCQGETVNFTDLSTGSPTAWSWSFPGASPSSAVTQNASATYNTPGSYAVTITVTNAEGTDSESKDAFITVLEGSNWYADTDNDTYGDPDNMVFACDQPAGYVANADDCDDTRDDVYLGAVGTEEGIDNDCNGEVEEDELLPVECMGDFNDDGMRDVSDLLSLLSFFGCL